MAKSIVSDDPAALPIELWPVDKPIPYARNARKISQQAIDKVAASIQEFGWRSPIVVDEENVILAGHTRLLAAQKLGAKRVPIHVARGLTKAQAKAFRLADNRTGTEATWDYELLGLELGELKNDLDFDLNLTGFDLHEIEPLLAADWHPEPPSESFGDDHQRSNTFSEDHTVHFTAEQFEVIGKGIFRLRDMEQEANIPDGRALELIVADWMTSLPLERDIPPSQTTNG